MNKNSGQRLFKIEGINQSILIGDANTQTYDGVEKALEFLNRQTRNEGNIIVLSGEIQSPSSESYKRISGLLKKYKPIKIIGIGDIKNAAEHFSSHDAEFYASAEAFTKSIADIDFSRKNILVKVDQSLGFQAIIERFEEKAHETELEIDLAKVSFNLKAIREMLKPTTEIMVMVKAFAYGNGSYDISRLLQDEGVEYLAVAYADAGFELRNNGITIPIMVLNPEIRSYRAMIRYNLEPQIFSFRTLKAFLESVNESGATHPYPIHIKINTGMNRLGFNRDEITELGEFLSASPQLEVRAAFTHLAASNDPAMDEMTHKQIAEFEAASTELKNILKKDFKRHVLNSGGIFRYPEAQFEMVRLGLSLYGAAPADEFKAKLKPVSRLTTRITQIRHVKPGETVGYNPKRIFDREAKIAVLAIGYADGLPRSLGHGAGTVWVHNKLAPFVGSICMDMCMVDVSEIDCAEGDEVEIFGDNQDIYAFAKQMQTIPYEVMTNISHRVKRVYLSA
ncbi:MAG: alanine racemase [Cryomorphaceae bacterium]|nr:alanine racemase [Flavobacteriales bacterium]